MRTCSHSGDPVIYNKQTIRGSRSALRIFEVALALFAERGFEATTMRDIAREAGIALGAAYRHFPTKESLALALYERLAGELEAFVPDMPSGSVSERFAATMHAKINLLQAQRSTLLALFSKALNPANRLGILADETARIRSRVAAIFRTLVQGADNAPSGDEIERWGRMLYGLHLAIILVWTQDRSEKERATAAAIKLASTLIGSMRLLQSLPPMQAFQRQFDELFSQLFLSADSAAPDERAVMILQSIFRRRRLLPGHAAGTTAAAMGLHLPRIQRCISQERMLQLVLPAFPAKAPNPGKVLGPGPDMAEWLALASLKNLCDEIAAYHQPGVQLVICSDGHVFADAVGLSDEAVELYLQGLRSMLDELGADNIILFHMRDAFGDLPPAQARARLFKQYAESTASLRARARHSANYTALLDGVHRFLFEDEQARCPELSRSQVRKVTRQTAYEVLRRSEAWGRLVAACFPDALRLSIHPQPDVSHKIGIHLTPSEDVWLTPWHAAAVLCDEGFRLMKRADASAMGAVLVDEPGNPAYLELSDDD